MSLRITDRDAFDSAVRKSYANRTAAATSPRTSRGAGREDAVKAASSVLPSTSEFSQAVLEGKVDPIGVLTYGRESIPTIDVLKAKLEVAKEEEQSAINAANQYVVDNMGWLDMKDPSELQELNDAAAAATEKREEIEREYYRNPDSFEDKVGDLGKFGRAAATVISKPFLAVDAAVQTAKDAASDQNKVNTTSLPMLKYGQMSQARASVTEDMGKVGAWLTNTGLSIADSAYSRLLGLGTPVGTGLVSGVSASADKMYQAAQNGDSASRALARGLISGGISGASEAMSVGNLAKLLKKDGANTVLGTMLKQGGFEATEEGVDYAANYIADKAFKDPNAKFSWSELVSNMASGGLSGAVFAGTGVAGSRVNTDTNVPTRGAAQPTLAEQITTMQKQLADMQFQKQVDELAAVYEKNVPALNKLDAMDLTGYDGRKGADLYGRGEKTSDLPRVYGTDVRNKTPEVDTRGASTYQEIDSGNNTGREAADWARGHVVEQTINLASATAESHAKDYYHDVYIVEDTALKARRPNAWATTSEGIIYISDSLPEELADVVGHHEVVHAARQQGNTGYQEFLDTVGERIDLKSDTIEDILEIILSGRFQEKGLFELNANELKVAYDELNAVIWGYYKADPNNARAQFAGMFKDYDSYIAELDAIMEDFKISNWGQWDD